jgi:sulfonate transport system ATP-binding protein
MTDHGTLEIRNVGKRFDVAGQTVAALRDVNLSVAPGEFVSIVGASGCGKSTLLRLIVGLERDYDGEILLKGNRLAGPTLDRAIVFQEHRLFPWLRVEDNVALGLLKSTLPADEKRRLVREHLDLVGLGSFAKAYPAQLSGGMSQRVAIARALVSRPDILLLDEPFGALDALTRAYLQAELRRIIRSEGITAILVTHDVEEAIFLGDRIVVMQPRPGRITKILPVDPSSQHDRASAAFAHLREAVLSGLGTDHPVSPGRLAA